MTIDNLINKCANSIDAVIIEFDNGTSEVYDMWDMTEFHKLEEYRYKKIDSYDMSDTDDGKILQVWL